MHEQEFGQNYIKLCLGIDRKIKDKWDGSEFIDGPDSMKALSDKQEQVPTVTELKDICAQLIDNINGESTIFSETRQEFLHQMLKGLSFSLQMLNDEELSYLEKVEAFYGIKPRFIEDDELSEYTSELNNALGGSGSIIDRFQKCKEAQIVKQDRIKILLDEMINHMRVVAKNYFTLPENETVEVDLVRDKPWGGYNYFKGEGVSKIVINIDRPLTFYRLLDVASHETYSGHHLEQILKEQKYVFDLNFFEEAILTYNTPKFTISEGIATMGLDLMFEGGTRNALEYCNDLAANSFDPQEVFEIQNIVKKFDNVKTNACFLLYVENKNKDFTIEYLNKWLAFDPLVVKHTMSFITHPMYATYLFNYPYGSKYVSEYTNKATASGFDKSQIIKTLFTEQLTPAILQNMI
ncbi:MAG: hypothetical protein ABIA04_09820 [Pseudomonadota bacterium]